MFNIRHGIFSSQNRAQYNWVLMDSTGSQGGFSEADIQMTDDGSDDQTMIANIQALYPADSYQGQTVNYYNSAYEWYSLFASLES
jgi:hypothetical protein